MLLCYFVGHDETHLFLIVTTKLIKIFKKYDKNPSFIDLKEFLFYFIEICYIFM